MSNRITIKTCEFCGKTYEAKKCDSLYCSATCRKYACIERQRRHWGWDVPATYTSYKFKQEKVPDILPIENVRGIDIGSLFQQTLDEFLKSKGF